MSAETTPGLPLARELGEWVAGMAAVPLPARLVAKASDHLLDTLGAIVAGIDEAPTRAAAEVFGRPGAVPQGGVLGLWHNRATSDRLDAAFVNGVAAHCLEIDDTEGCDHSGAVVVPVLLSLLPQASGVQGASRLLPALVAGYEVGRRIQLALGGYERHNARGWHSTATCGVFAAASAASVMLGLDGEHTASALGLAASSSSGGWAFSADGAMSKQFHPGQAARAGLEAALLAQAGARGPWRVFDPVWGGFFTTHGDDAATPDLLVRDLGSTWHFLHSAIKPYAACRSAHTALDAFRGILDGQGLGLEDVRAVRVHVSDFLRPMICPPHPRDAAQARMSLPHALALLLDGKPLVPEDFTHFDTPEVRARLELITVVPDSEAGREPLVDVTTEAGTFSARVEHARGGECHPLPADAVEAKFRSLTEGLLERTHQDEWIAWARSFSL